MIRALFAFLLLIGSVASADFSLAEQSRIRVYISNAPGMGHQSASVVVMRRLRQLGFQGTFEVVYNDAVGGKLNTLLPGFNPQQKDWQELSEMKIEAISESRFSDLKNVTQLELAITGADDNRKNMSPKKLHVQNYLLLEPQGWGESFLFQENLKPVAIPGLAQMGYFYEIDDSTNFIDKELKQIESNPEFGPKVPGLKALFRKTAMLGAVYGVGLIPNMPEKIRIWAQGIQKSETVLKFNRPTILPLISPLNETEMQQLRAEMKKAEGTLNGVPRRIHVMDIKDSNLPNVIAELRPGDMLLVQIGRLPQTLFEALFKRSQLPVLVAGKNAMNLAQNLGKPYLNTVNDLGVATQNNESRVQKMFREASEVFYFSKSHDAFLARLSLFIQATLVPNSEVNRYFDSLGSNGKDKVAEALKFLRAQALKNPSCSSVLL